MPDQIVKQPQRLPIPRSMYDSRQTGGANAQQQRSQLSQTNDSLAVPNPAPQPINGNAITGGRGIAQGSGLQFAGQGGLNALPDTLQSLGGSQVGSTGQSANDQSRRSQDPVLSRGVGPGGARTHSARPGVTGNDIDRLNGAKSFGNILTDSSLLTGGNNGLNQLMGGHQIGMAPPSNQGTSTDAQTSLPPAEADSTTVSEPDAQANNNGASTGTTGQGLYADDGSGDTPSGNEGGGTGYSKEDQADHEAARRAAAATFSNASGIDEELAYEIMNRSGADIILDGDNGYAVVSQDEYEQNKDNGDYIQHSDGKYYKLVDSDMDDSSRISSATGSLARRKDSEANALAEEKAAKSRKEAEDYIRELMGMQAPTLDQGVIDEQIGAQKSASDMERQKAIAMSLRMGDNPEAMQSQTTGINQTFGVNDVQQQSQIKMQAAVQNLQSKMAQYQNNVNSLMQLANMTNDDGVRAQAHAAQLKLMEMQKRGNMELMMLQQKMNEPTFGSIMTGLGGGLISGLTGGLVGAIANPLLGGLSNAVGGLVGNSRPGGY